MTCRAENGEWFIQAYNTENRISSIVKLESGDCTTPGSYAMKWDFAYDGDGVRAATLTTPYTSGVPQTGVLTAYYFGGAYEVTGSDVRKYYSFQGQSILRDDEGLQYILSDHLGSVVGITDDEGTLTSQQRYLPFGGVRQLGGSFITQTDYGYTGQRDDSYIKLMDYDFRWYKPELGRFISPDSIVPNHADPQSLNRYSYVANRPINFNDPTGHEKQPPGGNISNDCFQENEDGLLLFHISCLNFAEHTEETTFTISPVPAGGMQAPFVTFFAATSENDKNKNGGKSRGSSSSITPPTSALESLLEKNKRRGDAFRDELASLLEEKGLTVRKEVVKKTPFGTRRIDIEVISSDGEVLGGIEAKTGNSRYLPSQRSKDFWLKLQGYIVNLVRRK